MPAVANGCGFPDEIARQMLGVREARKKLSDSMFFALGFDFALKLGALLAANPLECPDLKDLISERRALVQQDYAYCADNVA
jgi:hypothetical protein